MGILRSLYLKYRSCVAWTSNAILPGGLVLYLDDTSNGMSLLSRAGATRRGNSKLCTNNRGSCCHIRNKWERACLVSCGERHAYRGISSGNFQRSDVPYGRAKLNR